MMRVSMKSILKSFGLIVIITLISGLSIGLLGRPAHAQEPQTEPEYIKLNSPSTSPQEPQIEYERLSSKEGIQADVTSYGYLRIITLDAFSGRAMPGLRYHIYNRDEEVIAEVVSDCSGAVQLDDLPTGYYRVEPQYAGGDAYIAFGGSYGWVFVGAGYRATLRFYTQPTIRQAGIRVYAYDIYTHGYLDGMPFSVYDYNSTPVFSGATNCSGFADFFEAEPGWYRVVPGFGQEPAETPVPETTPPPPGPGSWPPDQYGPDEIWVFVHPGYLVAVDFYLDPSAYSQATATPTGSVTTTETPGPGTPTATTAPPTNTPAPTAPPTPTATEPPAPPSPPSPP